MYKPENSKELFTVFNPYNTLIWKHCFSMSFVIYQSKNLLLWLNTYFLIAIPF